MFDLKPFEEAGCTVHMTTDDGSVGIKGRVSEIFDKIPLNKEETWLAVCGPTPMMKSVQDFAKANDLIGECSTEEVMACGIGACLGCVVKTTSGYQTTCHDGPVFDTVTTQSVQSVIKTSINDSNSMVRDCANYAIHNFKTNNLL